MQLFTPHCYIYIYAYRFTHISAHTHTFSHTLHLHVTRPKVSRRFLQMLQLLVKGCNCPFCQGALIKSIWQNRLNRNFLRVVSALHLAKRFMLAIQAIYSLQYAGPLFYSGEVSKITICCLYIHMWIYRSYHPSTYIEYRFTISWLRIYELTICRLSMYRY